MTIFLLTDFGLSDVYVGVMKAVMCGLAPDVRMIDLTHAVPPQNVPVGAFRLACAVPHVGDAAIFLSVVDPGVGGERRKIIVRCGRHLHVLPDNGLISGCAEQTPIDEAWEINEGVLPQRAMSNTFHGRDVFGPAAAWLTRNGGRVGALGKPIPVGSVQRRDWFHVTRAEKFLSASVVDIDNSGNVITAVKRSDLVGIEPASLQFECEAFSVRGLKQQYVDVREGEALAYVGSSEYVELALRNGSAASRFNIHIGDTVIVGLPQETTGE